MQEEDQSPAALTRGDAAVEWRLYHWHARELWCALARVSMDWSHTPWEKLPQQTRSRLTHTWGVIVSLLNHRAELKTAASG